MKALKSALGRYEISTDTTNCDCIVGHSFGTMYVEDSVNYALAEYILNTAEGRPIIADRTLVNAFHEAEDLVDYVVEGEVTSLKMDGVGTWGTLLEARDYMQKEKLQKALLVAQAHHIGRVMMQAKQLGIDAVAPEGLPSQFDWESEQVWTKSIYLWVPFETLGSIALRHKGRL